MKELIIIKITALAGVTQWTECQPTNKRVAGWIPSQGTFLGCQPGPCWRYARGSQLMYLSHTPSLSPSLPIFLKTNK